MQLLQRSARERGQLEMLDELIFQRIGELPPPALVPAGDARVLRGATCRLLAVLDRVYDVFSKVLCRLAASLILGAIPHGLRCTVPVVAKAGARIQSSAGTGVRVLMLPHSRSESAPRRRANAPRAHAQSMVPWDACAAAAVRGCLKSFSSFPEREKSQ